MNNDLHLQFNLRGDSFSFDLREESIASSESVVLDGHIYSLQGTDCSRLKAMAPELTSTEGIPSDWLKERLRNLKAKDVELVDKTCAIALERMPGQRTTGTVIALIGTSSVGKTTIINAIKSLDPKREELGVDRRVDAKVYKYLAKHYKEHGILEEDWNHLHKVLVPEKGEDHIHNVIQFEKYNFKLGTSEEDQKRARATGLALSVPVEKWMKKHSDTDFAKHFMHKSLELAKKGQDVIFDVVCSIDFKQDPLSEGLSVKTVLVHCPFLVLSERIRERNRQAVESGNLGDIRAGVFPLIQFGQIYGPRKEADTDADVIDTVTKGMIETEFNLHFDAGVENDKMRNPKEPIPGDIETTRTLEREKLLTALGFKPSDSPEATMELTPRQRCDFRINTADPSLGITIEEQGRTAAGRILEFMKISEGGGI